MAAAPRSSPHRPWLRAATLVLALTAAWSGDALAQATPTITLGRIARYRGDIDEANYDYRTTRPWWISYADCIHNDVFVFPIAVTNPSNRLEVWAGNDDCIAARGNTTERGQCWIVASVDRVTRNFDVTVPVRNIVQRATGGITVPSGLGTDVCEGSTDTDGNQLDLYFLIESGGKALGPGLKWSGASQGTGFDLVGPLPPDSVKVGIGDQALILGIKGVDEDQELERFGAFCVEGVPRDSSAAAAPLDADAGADAGTSTDAGTTTTVDAGTAAPNRCFTSLLVKGERPPVDDAYACGTANRTSGSLRTKRLVNDQVYAIGVAGEDILGNAGVLSNIQCGTPRDLDSFYDQYTEAGGTGGGGICSLNVGRTRAAPGAALLFGLVLAALHRRRARRNA